jgi:hypothetical protein
MKNHQDAGEALIKIFLESPIKPSLAMTISGPAPGRFQEISNSSPEMMRLIRRIDNGTLPHDDASLIATLARNLQSLGELALREKDLGDERKLDLQRLVEACQALLSSLPSSGQGRSICRGTKGEAPSDGGH